MLAGPGQNSRPAFWSLTNDCPGPKSTGYRDRRRGRFASVKRVNSYLKEKGKTETIPDLGSVRGLAVPKDFVDNNPEAFKKLYDAYKTAVNSPEYKEWLKTTGRDTITLSKSMEETEKLVSDYHQFFVDNANYLTGQ